MSKPVTKRSFQAVQLHLNRFNEVAIPCHVDLLRKHKSNIVKFQEIGDWKKVYREQVNATRLLKQLKSLLHEIEALRLQVHDCDLQKFDQSIAKSKQLGLDSIYEYSDIKIYHAKPSECNDNVTESNYKHGTETISNVHDELQILEEDIMKKNECLRAYNAFQDEIQELNDLCKNFSVLVQDQAESVNAVDNHTLDSAEHVNKGNRLLAKAAKYNTAAFPIAGAIIGTAIGGPLGVLLGAKIGSVLAVGGMALGYTGGRILKKTEDLKYKAICDVELNVMQSDGPNIKTSP